MTGQCAAAEQQHHDLPSRVVRINDGKRQQGAAERLDQRMHPVPYGVESGDRVGQKFDDETDPRIANPVANMTK